MTAQIYLALICQMAITQSFASEVVSAKTTTCSVHGDSKCAQGELGSSDDAQVLLQSQTLEVKQHSDLGNAGTIPEAFKFRVRPQDFELSMTMTTAVKINNEIRGDGDLAAFVGGKLQGLCSIAQTVPTGLGSYAGKQIYHLMIYGHGSTGGTTPDSGKGLTFKWLSHDGSLIDLEKSTESSAISSTFQSDGILGNALKPVVLTAVASPAAQMLLQVPGEAKFGFNVNPPDFESSMSVTAAVKIDGQMRADGDLAAFVGGKLHGVNGKALVPPWPNAVPVYHLMVYGHGSAGGTTPDSGKGLTFMWLSHDGNLIRLESVTPPMAQTFSSDGILGDAKKPVVLTPVAGAAPLPQQACTDAPQDEMDAFIKNTYNLDYPGLTCAMFKGWSQCGKVAGVCDKTCHVCT